MNHKFLLVAAALVFSIGCNPGENEPLPSDPETAEYEVFVQNWNDGPTTVGVTLWPEQDGGTVYGHQPILNHVLAAGDSVSATFTAIVGHGYDMELSAYSNGVYRTLHKKMGTPDSGVLTGVVWNELALELEWK